jgi:two-component system chemotaxis sensor kinase CheA
MFAMEGVEELFDILATHPERADIEDGDYEGTFSLFIDADDLGRVDAEMDSVGKIETATVTDVTDDLEGGDDATPAGSAGGSGGSGETDHSVDEIKSVRVDVDQLDDLHGLVEQLVTSRIKLRRAVEQDDLDSAGETLNELDKITANLQNTVMDMRLIPLKKVVGKFPRMVRDLSRELDKEVNFEIEGEDIELDRTILTEISDPLMHIIRNSLDHGVEAPDERERKGKPREGQVTLRASRERDHVIIQVEDDGAGLDVEGIKAKAIEKEVRSPEELETMDDSAIYDLIFHPGFSTADEVTDTSGRGVGMDVVHDTVTQLDGSVDVESTPGEGTTVSLRLPVTMAIVKVLFVEVGDEEYGIPIKNVDEITRTDNMKQLNDREVIKHNDEIYPVIDLGEAFDVPGRAATDGSGEEMELENVDDPGGGMLVRIRESERQVALKCDSVNAQEEVVVKPLEGILSGTPGLSGTAVLGDGNIVHILDVVTL